MQTTVVVKAGSIRSNGLSRSTQTLSPCRSRTSQGLLSQPVFSCPSGINARIPRLLQRPSKEGLHEVIAWVWGSVRHGNAMEQYSWAHSVLIRTLFPEGMSYGRANLEASCLLLHHVLVACTLVELHKAFRRRMPQRWACRVARVLSAGWFRLIQDLDTSLVVHVRVWVLHKVGLWSGLHVSHNIYGACRLGRKDANEPWYRLLTRKLWRIRFFPLALAIFPTISQTSAAEALAISMEASMGNARDVAEERRLRCKGENAMVRAPRRRPSSWRRRKRQPWGRIWGCSAATEALSNRSHVKPVQFPGALELDVLFSLLCTAQIQCVLWFSRSSSSVGSLQAGAVPAVLCERFEPVKLSVDPAAEVAAVGNCIISVWSVQTCL